ncbi:M28 family metallopeptidase [Sphingomonas mucosissima]|uniref:Leupeptin-inactivating enzyme 1 n=1 Tax=Sphingomonas mucosissima TaxID=370959 RepID=A0A245ZGV2_9SPHN|nr:M28 family metallopeptidase [Sphingomonas mucosissima]OWK28948.1 leupeptin-inactivating enzyme 1 precursor [Sphingomonas mucosissima]
MRRLILALCLTSLPVAAIAQATAAKGTDTQHSATPGTVAPAVPPAAAPLSAGAAAIKSHVMFLAADAMRGREAGSPEYDIAAEYVAAQFFAAGLKPGGDKGGYAQNVPLVSYKPDGQGTLAITGAAGQSALTFGTDYIPSSNPRTAETSVSAPVVFVGYGIVAPQYGRDDYRGVDVKGKIVAFVSGSPSKMTGEERAWLGAATTKARFAAERGAVGTIALVTPRSDKQRPFARLVEANDHSRMTWANADGTGHVEEGGIPALATLSLSGAQKLFAGARTSWAKIARAAEKADATFTPEALPVTVSATTKTKFEQVRSSNVVGVLPGSDPALSREVVVLSAHLDHVGVSGKAEDKIHNGALDNAIGIASLIEEAKRFQKEGPAKRTILFLAVTAEEKGLVGSDYFANHPTVPAESIIANVNLDMPILTYKFEDMVAFGGDRSTLGPIIRGAVEGAGVALSPDPIPDEGIFVRSDHFRFVQKGVPSVFLWPGQKGPGKAAVEHFLSTNYHKPTDDLSQPIEWEEGVRFVDVNYRIARNIGDAATRPVWNKGDYFGTLFKGPMAP